MTAVLDAVGLGKRYGRRDALVDCTLSIPAGHVVGLVGPNGAGKTTLLQLAVGLLAPTSGSITVLGARWPRPLPGCWRWVPISAGVASPDGPALAWRSGPGPAGLTKR